MLPESTVEMIKITVESMNPHGWVLPPQQAANWLHSNVLTTSEPGAPVFLSIPVETAMQ